MHLIGYLISLIITGLIIGALGRLAVPGPNPIGIGLTILLGIGGALIGGLVAAAIGAGVLLAIVLEIAAAALLVYAVSGSNRRRFGPGRGRRILR